MVYFVTGGRSAWYNVTIYKSNLNVAIVQFNIEMSHDTEINLQNYNSIGSRKLLHKISADILLSVMEPLHA